MVKCYIIQLHNVLMFDLIFLDELDFNCKDDDDFLSVMQNSTSQRGEHEFRMLIWVLLYRQMELKQIQDRFSNFEFSETEEIYEKLISNLILAEEQMLQKCIPMLQRMHDNIAEEKIFRNIIY